MNFSFNAEVKTTQTSASAQTDTPEQQRSKRDVVLKTALETELNGDNEDENLAIEEVCSAFPVGQA